MRSTTRCMHGAGWIVQNKKIIIAEKGTKQMGTYKVVVTDDRYENYKEENAILSELGIEVEVHDFKDKEEAIETLKDADGVLVNLFPLTKEIISNMKKCRIINRYGVGYDNVDVDAATEMGIWVSRVPDYSLEDVSDHALALLLNSIRKISYKDRMIRNGKWNLHKDWPSFRIAGKTLGLIGFGAISKTLFRKVSGFGLDRILIHDPFVKDETILDAGGTPSSLNDLLKASDYISIHAPLTKDTENMIGKNEFEIMKNNAIIINTSRGPIIDKTALYNALKDKQIAAAGIDVYKEEPLPAESLDHLTFAAGEKKKRALRMLKRRNLLNADGQGAYREEASRCKVNIPQS